MTVFNNHKKFAYIKLYVLTGILALASSLSPFLYAQKSKWQKLRFFDLVSPLFPVAVTCMYQGILPIDKYLNAEHQLQNEQNILSTNSNIQIVQEELTVTRAELSRLQNRIYPHVTCLTVVRSAEVAFDQYFVEMLYRMFPSLEQLVLSSNMLTDTEFGFLANSPLSFRIRVLDLTLNNLTSRSMSYLKSFTNLEELNLSTNLSLGNGGVETLSSITFLTEQLRVLNLESTGITSHGAGFIRNFTNIRRLVLAANDIGNAGLRCIAEGRFAAVLTSLDVGDTGVTGWGVRNLIAPNFAQLQELYLSDNTDTLDSTRRDWLSSLATARFAPHLSVLMLSATNLLSSDIEILRTSFPRLTVLDVSFNRLTTRDVETLSTAVFAATLQELDVSNNRIQQEAVFDTLKSRFIKLRKLRKLRISSFPSG